MGAEEERRAGVAVRGSIRQRMLPIVEPILPADVVLVGLEPERAQVVEHAVGDGPLLPRRARQRGQLEEEREDVGCPAPALATRRS